MAVKRKWYGKIVKDVKGYKVRHMGKTRTTRKPNGTEKTVFLCNGEFGVYAGRKKLVKDGFKTVDSAVDYVNTL